MGDQGVKFPAFRGLGDFCSSVSQFRLPALNDGDKWANRVVNNLLYYQTNYFAVLAIIITVDWGKKSSGVVLCGRLIDWLIDRWRPIWLISQSINRSHLSWHLSICYRLRDRRVLFVSGHVSRGISVRIYRHIMRFTRCGYGNFKTSHDAKVTARKEMGAFGEPRLPRLHGLHIYQSHRHFLASLCLISPL